MSALHGAPPVPFSAAGLVLEALAVHDFPRLAKALEEDALLSALLPRGFVEWRGATAICGAFEQWFGDVEAYEVTDASVGQVGGLLQLRWRLRVEAARLGDGPKVVEQHAFAATGPTGRIERLSLLCSGFWSEHVEA